MLTRNAYGPYPTRAEYFYLRLHWDGRVSHTIPHLAKATDLSYVYLVYQMVIVQISYGYGYTRGSGRVGSINITEPTLTPVAIGVARILSGVHFSSPKKLTTFLN